MGGVYAGQRQQQQRSFLNKYRYERLHQSLQPDEFMTVEQYKNSIKAQTFVLDSFSHFSEYCFLAVCTEKNKHWYKKKCSCLSEWFLVNRYIKEYSFLKVALVFFNHYSCLFVKFPKLRNINDDKIITDSFIPFIFVDKFMCPLSNNQKFKWNLLRPYMYAENPLFQTIETLYNDNQCGIQLYIDKEDWFAMKRYCELEHLWDHDQSIYCIYVQATIIPVFQTLLQKCIQGKKDQEEIIAQMEKIRIKQIHQECGGGGGSGGGGSGGGGGGDGGGNSGGGGGGSGGGGGGDGGGNSGGNNK